MFTLLFLLQDAGTQAVTTTHAVDLGFDTQKFLDTVVNAVQTGNWKAGAALALIFCVYLARKGAKKLPWPVGPWLLTDRGGSATVLVMGALGGVATALLAGQKLSLNLVLSGLTTGAMASGLRNVVWDLAFPKDVQQPAAGLVALDPPPPPPAA